MGSVVKSIGNAFGFGADDAVKDASKKQVKATEATIEYLKEADALARADLQPYNQFGLDNMGALQGLLTPEGQYDYLQNNPMFQAAIDNTNRATSAFAAANGRLDSGGTIDQLFQNYLSMGESFLTNQFNRLLPSVTLGQNSAARQAANSLQTANAVGNAMTSIGDIQAASQIAQYNANAALGSNILGLGMAAFSGGLFGGGTAGSIGTAPVSVGGRYSDARLKTDIEYIGKDPEGNNLYEYSYKSPERYVGYMAQEVAKKDPKNILIDGEGYLMVTEKYAPVRVS